MTSTEIPHRLARLALFGILILFWTATGCERQEEIVRYRVPKPLPGDESAESAPAARSSGNDRMLGAIVPREKTMWFFKLAGSESAVQPETARFLSFIQSLDFSDDDHALPAWTLPEGWQRVENPAETGGFSRAATIQVGPADQKLELTVTTLPIVGDAGNFVVQNVNRWRGQMGRSSLAEDELQAAGAPENDEIPETGRVVVDGSTATLVNLRGTLSSRGMGTAPFASPAPPASPSAPSSSSDVPTFDVPEGWTEAPGTTLSVASFRIGEGDRSAEVTVTPLAAAAADLMSNVNRWRGQIQLPPWTADEVQQHARPIEVGGTQAWYVEFFSPDSADPREGILGVIAVKGDRSWFFKLKGDAEVAKAEKERFENFARSTRFSESASDGN